MMYEYFISFILSFIVAFFATPMAKKLAFKIGAVDVPKDDRRMHKKPIARLGGLAIIAGFMISVLFYVVDALYDGSSPLRVNSQFFGLLAGIVIIVALGIADDIKSLSARFKLVFQIIAALAVVISGTRIEYVTNPLSKTGISQLNPILSYTITLLWIIGITNALNFIDGLDGLAAGVSSIASLSLFIVSVIFERWDVAILTAALAGSALGFLPYNFNPAKIFMGDTGATFLGFTLGVVSIQGTLKSYAAIAIAIPVLVLGLPLFDTIFAILRRLLNHKPIMEADRGHLHHRLIDMGLSQKQSVVIMYILSAALGLSAIVLADKGALSAIILIIAISIFIIGGTRFMNEINIDKDDSNNTETHTSKVDVDGKHSLEGEIK
ncbi:MraY family glycosyltransferase [Clostridium thermosuccinogenes]|jgi:UDP-GlcNAc:undecaprenyl-phosphate GlcNAc-1-phosphate transferase|uniref:MraY family glycosyltransferase n=1 Tax=Clostridium thermosuccinogenes TaxID=84032 RepID=UPI000CCBF30F|nr:MraY family glycosyltransferase [Pseudoclostridium thermosuccinogenes]PNT90947.1 undecaprenyl-phosphate alpha-N-acetylglucosaminyl 1-phosphate transferase [Pseudoclostridium thermosuccinogenes]